MSGDGLGMVISKGCTGLLAMASAPYRSWVLLILVVAAAVAMRKVEADTKMSVRVVNHLADTLQLLCSSRENNLKVQYLAPGRDFFFAFYVNLWGTTDFWCQFHYINAKLWNGFDVWVGPGFWGARTVHCQHCLWDVRLEGFFRGEEGSGKDPIFKYPWKVWALQN